MVDALDAFTSGGMSYGALGAAYGKNREQKATDKAEAIQAGRGVSGQDEINAKVRGVAEEFVSIFMNQVMKSMRSTVQENEKMHGDNGEKFFQEMLDTEQSKSLAKGSGYGLTDLVYQALMSNVQVTQADASAGSGTESGQELVTRTAVD